MRKLRSCLHSSRRSGHHADAAGIIASFFFLFSGLAMMFPPVTGAGACVASAMRPERLLMRILLMRLVANDDESAVLSVGILLPPGSRTLAASPMSRTNSSSNSSASADFIRVKASAHASSHSVTQHHPWETKRHFPHPSHSPL